MIKTALNKVEKMMAEKVLKEYLHNTPAAGAKVVWNSSPEKLLKTITRMGNKKLSVLKNTKNYKATKEGLKYEIGSRGSSTIDIDKKKILLQKGRVVGNNSISPNIDKLKETNPAAFSYARKLIAANPVSSLGHEAAHLKRYSPRGEFAKKMKSLYRTAREERIADKEKNKFVDKFKKSLSDKGLRVRNYPNPQAPGLIEQFKGVFKRTLERAEEAEKGGK